MESPEQIGENIIVGIWKWITYLSHIFEDIFLLECLWWRSGKGR